MAGRNESECSSNPNQERPVVHGPTKPKGLDYIGQTIEDTRDDVVDALRNANDRLQNHGVEVYPFSVRVSF